jgi:hypothetical protein
MAQEPSAYLRIVQEDIKEGKSAAHVKSEMAFARALAKTAFPNYVAWDAETGPSQVWFLERYDSFDAMEQATNITASEPLRTTLSQLEEVDGTLRTGSRTIIARYEKDLSYTPVPAEIAKYRYYNVYTFRIRPGHQADFAEMRRITNEAWAKAGYKGRRVVYAVISGAPAGTYFAIQALRSLQEMDGSSSGTAASGTKLYQDVVVSSEQTLFAVNPKMSNPPKEYITADPDFWAPKPKPVAAK